jgi:hypothetical protein
VKIIRNVGDLRDALAGFERTASITLMTSEGVFYSTDHGPFATIGSDSPYDFELWDSVSEARRDEKVRIKRLKERGGE